VGEINNWELMQLDNKLSESDYMQLYYTLFREETCNILYKKPEIYEFIDKVRTKFNYMSKSGKANIYWCQQQFKYSRLLLPDIEDWKRLYIVLNIPILEEFVNDRLTISGKIGGNVHLVMNRVWDVIDVDKIKSFKSSEEISDYIFNRCISFIPMDEIANNMYEYFFRQYSDYESFRISSIINELGTNNSIKKYIVPEKEYRELKVENKSIGKAGVIDVLLRLLDDSYAITDYKTGKPKYYYNQFYDGCKFPSDKWEKKDIEREITEYFLLVQEGAFKVINENDMIEMDPINVRFGRILYLSDWVNTCQYVEINPEMIVDSKKTDDIIEDCVNTGFFRRRITQYCPINCEFYQVCKNSYEFRKKYKDLSKKVDEAFLYFRKN